MIRRKLLVETLNARDLSFTPLHFEIMRLLQEAGTLHMTEIGERLHIAKAQMTHLIDKLVDASIVERRTNEVDRRKTGIVLTDKGRAFLSQHDDEMKHAAREALSSLTDGELKDLADSLSTLQKIFSKKIQ
jgi:DNA-binding MarR family transcriptional regulator